MLTVESIALLPMVSIVLALSPSPSRSGDIVGKVVVGYAAYYGAEGDGSPQDKSASMWSRWNVQGEAPNRSQIQFEMFPDLREYSQLYNISFNNSPSGHRAQLFSSWDNSTIDLHFNWMRIYNIDVVALERRGENLTSNKNNAIEWSDGIAVRVQKYAEKHDLKFYITYRLKRWLNFATEFMSDLDHVKGLGVFNSAAYAKQDGKLVIGVRDISFVHSESPKDAASVGVILSNLRSQGFYIIGGVPNGFLTGGDDTAPGFSYADLDMYQPDTLRLFKGVNDVVSFRLRMRTIRDSSRRNGHDYQVVLYPGFGDSNTRNDGTPFNEYPRLRGNLLWRQFVNMRELGLKNAYIYSFDGFKYASAIAKVAEDATQTPPGQNFVRLNDDGQHVSADFYLRLVAEGSRMMKGQVGLKYFHNVSFHNFPYIRSRSLNVHSETRVTRIQLVIWSILMNLIRAVVCSR